MPNPSPSTSSPDSTSAELVARARALLQEITPGHWLAIESPNEGQASGVVDEALDVVLYVGVKGRPNAANARFIAASPELVDSLATALEQAQTDLRERDERIAELEVVAGSHDYHLKALHRRIVLEGVIAVRPTLLRALELARVAESNPRWGQAVALINALENTDQPTPAKGEAT